MKDWKRPAAACALLTAAGFVCFPSPVLGQTRVDLQSQTKNIDFAGTSSVRPFPVGVTLPPVCRVGETWFKTDAAAGENLFLCTATNIWSAVRPADEAPYKTVKSVNAGAHLSLTCADGVDPQSGNCTLDVTTGSLATLSGNNALSGITSFPAGSPQTLTAGSAILCNATRVAVTSATAVTLTATPLIADAGRDGQMCIVQNAGSNDMTLTSGTAANLRLTGTTLLLKSGEALTLIWDQATSLWTQVGGSGSGGADAQVQYNASGSLAGAACTYDAGGQSITCPGGFTSGGGGSFLMAGATGTQPATPPAGQMSCWFHTDDSFRCVNGSGVVTTLSGAGVSAYQTLKNSAGADLAQRPSLKLNDDFVVGDDGVSTTLALSTTMRPTVGSLQAGTPWYASDSGTGDTYAACPATTIGSLTQGMTLTLRANTANTDGATFNLCGLGDRPILKLRDQPLTTGDIEAAQLIALTYDSAGNGGTGAWQMQSQLAQSAGGGSGGTWGGITGTLSAQADLQAALNAAAASGVTSVGLTTPAWLTVAGSPVTSSGTLAVSAATGQTANRVLATPDGTTGSVALRTLVPADMPALDIAVSSRLVEDFGTGRLQSSSLGTHGWTYANGSQSYQLVSGRPGVVRRTSSNAAIAYLASSFDNSATFNPADNFDITWSIRSTIDSDTTVRVGAACNGQTGAQPSEGMYFEKLPGDTSWFAVNRAGSMDSARSNIGAAVSGAWTKLRIRRSGPSIAYSVDGGAESTIGAQIPSTGCNLWTVIVSATAASKDLDHDYAVLQVTGLNR